MSKAPTKFKQADVKRAVAGVKSCGLSVGRVEIGADGKIAIYTSEVVQAEKQSAYDAWKAGTNAHSS